jgi:hypothetical protein
LRARPAQWSHKGAPGISARRAGNSTVATASQSTLAGEHHRALVVLGVDGHVARPPQLWLRHAHADAYHPTTDTWQRVADWHERHRPGNRAAPTAKLVVETQL